MSSTANKIHFSGEYARVYVWELPVRIFHWVNALAITVLTITGFLIASPVTLNPATEASYMYTQGTIRFIHFAAAYVFIINLAFRIYWGFVGNDFARWKTWLPLSVEKWKEIKTVIRVDILQTDEHEHVSPAHNALASLIYLGLGAVMLLSIITGLGLYADMSESYFPYLFSWIIPLFGGDYMVRMIHHGATWFFILFTIVHVYLTFYHDYVEGRAVVSSMVGGWKFCRVENIKAHQRKTGHSDQG